MRLIIKHQLTVFQQQDLTRSVSEKQVKHTIFSFNGSKAPGVDGYITDFFKHSWKMVGKDVTDAIFSFFATGRMLKAINTTSVSLVPKVPNFRSISCRNIVYKCITKILTNRMRVVLPAFISQNQSTFVHIIGSTLLTVAHLKLTL